MYILLAMNCISEHVASGFGSPGFYTGKEAKRSKEKLGGEEGWSGYKDM